MEIKGIKEACGFHDLYQVPALRLKEVEKIIKAREEKGERLSIEPKDIESRVDPRRSLPEVRSIFVAFEQTPFSKEEPKSIEGTGRLAGISRDLDYHLILNRKMEALESYLKKSDPHIALFRQVDTGPLYERGFAELTGRGYIGKNGSFIHRTLGSYVAIGLLLTDLDGGKIGEISESCGNCKACTEACPGGAIDSEGRINPTRCRSWITQKRGDLTEREREIMADWIYGCDVCQRVCPKNKGISPVFSSYRPRERIALDAIEEESNRSFKRHYGYLSGSWRGAKQWKKNAAYIREYFEKEKRESCD